MWWTIFTAVDLYIGLIIIDSLASTVAPEKQRRLARARRATWAALAVTIVVLVVQILRRH